MTAAPNATFHTGRRNARLRVASPVICQHYLGAVAATLVAASIRPGETGSRLATA